MVILIAGASHTGKTLLAQRILEAHGFPYLSIDHLKMGLIRSGMTALTPQDDDALLGYLWPIVREIVKTSIENRQNRTVEGAYIPFDWKKDCPAAYRSEIRYRCLVMTEAYIRRNFAEIRQHASAIEQRGDDPDCTLESVLADNARNLRLCRESGCESILIDGSYDIPLDF